MFIAIDPDGHTSWCKRHTEGDCGKTEAGGNACVMFDIQDQLLASATR